MFCTFDILSVLFQLFCFAVAPHVFLFSAFTHSSEFLGATQPKSRAALFSRPVCARGGSADDDREPFCRGTTSRSPDSFNIRHTIHPEIHYLLMTRLRRTSYATISFQLTPPSATVCCPVQRGSSRRHSLTRAGTPNYRIALCYSSKVCYAVSGVKGMRVGVGWSEHCQDIQLLFSFEPLSHFQGSSCCNGNELEALLDNSSSFSRA